MTQQPAGWYDDPKDLTSLRYWDGVIWTSHVAPKKSPTVDQSTIGTSPQSDERAAQAARAAQDAAATQDRPVGPAPGGPGGDGSGQGGHGQGGYGQGGYGQGGYGQGGYGQGGYGQGGYGQGAPQSSYPSYASYPSSAPPVQLGRPLATTPDGAVLAGWWKRVLARIIDAILVFVVSLPLTYSSYATAARTMADYFRQVVDAAQAGTSTIPAQPTGELAGPLLRATIFTVLVAAIYEIWLVSSRGATVGKMLVGISVRLRDRPGPPPLVVAVKRYLVKDLGNIVGVVPVLSFFGSLFGLLDSLWPLWDPNKQALHDKAAATNVVVGPQVRSGRPPG